MPLCLSRCLNNSSAIVFFCFTVLTGHVVGGAEFPNFFAFGAQNNNHLVFSGVYENAIIFRFVFTYGDELRCKDNCVWDVGPSWG